MIAVSIRKDIDKGFEFPKPIPLEVKFRDLLEENPDEKFFLNQEMYEFYKKHNEKAKEMHWSIFFTPVERERAEVSKTLTTNAYRTESNYINEV